MSQVLLAELIKFSVKYGIDAAIALIETLGSNPTPADVVKAFRAASEKTAADYKAEAKATLGQ